MIQEDKIKHIKQHYEEEIKGANSYLDMFENAYKMGDYDLYKGLAEMAKDEYSHAEFIKGYLENNMVKLDSEECDMLNELEERIAKLFR